MMNALSGVFGYGVNQNHEEGLKLLMTGTDSYIAGTVKNRLPRKCYSCVNVVTVNDYNFFGISTKDARLISLTVTKSEQCGAMLYAFFAGLGIIDSKQITANINQGKLKEELLDHICDSGNSADEIKKAYAQCSDIDLYIASDLSAIELKLREGNSVIITYKVTEFLKETLPVVVPIIISLATGSK